MFYALVFHCSKRLNCMCMWKFILYVVSIANSSAAFAKLANMKTGATKALVASETKLQLPNFLNKFTG